jgi:DNA-binding response OmpR family regulator
MSDSSGTARILVADNDEDILTLVAFRLERQGYEVLVARDGAEALERAREELPDLCVLDVMMPKLTGYDVTRKLRADPRTERVPVILLTARVQEADVRNGFDAGADGYVRKPFSPQELRERVEATLARGRAGRAGRATG